ncbi:MAG: hypothetical protein EXR60_04055 [Dehalococcoidia bacterium]|nr:hypothetical protein [Dehalococcoidia bacterium]
MEQRVAVTTSYPYQGVQFEVAFRGPDLVVKTMRAGTDGRPQLVEVQAYAGTDGAFHPYAFERQSLGAREAVKALNQAPWKSCG